ncbi:MAG: hypothetical protein K9N49_07965, partial [Candidatus Marinimicrobia bacterium]|nr:hypothetical protein [Candidatus Neomarinimicrobiota bacterium]
HWVAASRLAFAYRSSALKRRKALVLRARFHTPCAPAAELLADYDRLLALRRSKHPDWRREPCAGSVFRNPTPGAPGQPSAGWYLEQVGAPAWQVGGAGIFARHANIIVKADPACRAAHVLELMTRMRQAVAERFGLLLEPEILCVGRFPNRPRWAQGPDAPLALEAPAE